MIEGGCGAEGGRVDLSGAIMLLGHEPGVFRVGLAFCECFEDP